MSVPVLTFFNNKGGVGKTTLVYHLAWMYADQGKRVLAADLDPQSNLAAAFLSEDALEALWDGGDATRTVYDCVRPLLRGTGDLADPELQRIDEGLYLLPGDINLSAFENELSSQWTKCLDGDERAFRVTTAFWRVIQAAAAQIDADVILVDVGPNLGAINRAALVATDAVIVPLAPDLFSLRGLDNLGPTLRDWRTDWNNRTSLWGERARQNRTANLNLPSGAMRPVGYVALQHSVRLDRPTVSYDKWMARIPSVYHRSVLGDSLAPPATHEDPECLATLKHYRSLMPMAQEAHKPVFHLRAADGAIGAHARAVQAASQDFADLAARIAERALRDTSGDSSAPTPAR